MSPSPVTQAVFPSANAVCCGGVCGRAALRGCAARLLARAATGTRTDACVVVAEAAAMVSPFFGYLLVVIVIVVVVV